MSVIEHKSPWGRNLALALAFLVLVGIGVVTVLLPELRDDPVGGSGERKAPEGTEKTEKTAAGEPR